MNSTAHAARIDYIGARQRHAAATGIRRIAAARRLSRAERVLARITGPTGYCAPADYARLTGMAV